MDDLDTNNDTQMDGSDLLKKLRKAKRNDEKRIKELTEQDKHKYPKAWAEYQRIIARRWRWSSRQFPNEHRI